VHVGGDKDSLFVRKRSQQFFGALARRGLSRDTGGRVGEGGDETADKVRHLQALRQAMCPAASL
jgi:hypothetical protein